MDKGSVSLILLFVINHESPSFAKEREISYESHLNGMMRWFIPSRQRLFLVSLSISFRKLLNTVVIIESYLGHFRWRHCIPRHTTTRGDLLLLLLFIYISFISSQVNCCSSLSRRHKWGIKWCSMNSILSVLFLQSENNWLSGAFFSTAKEHIYFFPCSLMMIRRLLDFFLPCFSWK